MEENLWAISIDPDEAMREYVLLQLKVRAMRDMLFRSRIFSYLAAATPGLKELVTIGKIWELAQLDRKVKKGRKYDLVIVDAPATGHGIGFLQTPRTFAAIARVGPIHSQAQQLDRFIVDHQHTGTAIVALPEEMPVNESAALEEELRYEVGVAVDRVYLNGLYPERFSNEEAERLAGLAAGENGALRAAARAAASEHERARSQRAQLARLRRRVQAPVKTLPFLFEPELGVEAARQLARRLPDARRGRAARGQGHLHLRRLRRGRQDDDLGGDRARHGGARAERLRLDDRPGEAARRLARPEASWATRRGGSTRSCSPRTGVEMQGELWAMMLDAKATFDELVARQAPDEESRDRVLNNRIYQQISNALAGSQEYMAMEKLFELHTEGRFDLLVLDTPPTRNALDFLDAPRRLTQFIEGRSLRVFMRPTGLAARVAGRGASVALSVFKRIVGFDLLADLAEFFNAFSGMVDGFQARAKRVNGLLADPAHLLPRRLRPAGRADRRGGLLPPQAGRGEAALRRGDRQQGPLPGRAAAGTASPTTRRAGGAWGRRRDRRGGGGAGDGRPATTAGRGSLDRRRPGLASLAENFADYQALAERDARNIEHLARELRTSGVIRVPYLDEDVHDLGGLAEIDRYLFASNEERIEIAAGRA